MKSLMIMLSSVILFALVVLPSQVSATSITETKAAIGEGCDNSGDRSIAMGNYTTASGYASTAMGTRTKAIGDYSTAMGLWTTANGDYSTAMGSHATAYSAYETVIGWHPEMYLPASTTEWIGSDRLFVIANGYVDSGINRSNAMVVLKNGDVGIGTSTPGEELEIYSNYPYVKFNGHSSSDARQIGVNNYGFVIYNADDAQYEMVISNIGNVGIGVATNIYYKLQVNGDAAGNSWTNFSSKEFKEDINKVDDAAHSVMLAKLIDMDLTTYRYKEQYGGDGEVKLGFIAEEMPQEVLSKDGKGVDLYELITLTIGAIKAQEKKIRTQHKENEMLRAENASLKRDIEKIKKILGI